jgi:aspartyl-tRNA(Asn)/glutamyl-tRNA(Gln) amidotransferase subunit C
MSKNSKIIDIDYVAALAKIDIDNMKKEDFQRDMENIVNYVNQLAELDVEGVIPTAHAVEMNNVLREDKVATSSDRGAMLSNSPENIDSELIKVPQVISGEGAA